MDYPRTAAAAALRLDQMRSEAMTTNANTRRAIITATSGIVAAIVASTGVIVAVIQTHH